MGISNTPGEDITLQLLNPFFFNDLSAPFKRFLEISG